MWPPSRTQNKQAIMDTMQMRQTINARPSILESHKTGRLTCSYYVQQNNQSIQTRWQRTLSVGLVVLGGWCDQYYVGRHHSPMAVFLVSILGLAELGAQANYLFFQYCPGVVLHPSRQGRDSWSLFKRASRLLWRLTRSFYTATKFFSREGNFTAGSSCGRRLERLWRNHCANKVIQQLTTHICLFYCLDKKYTPSVSSF